LSAFDANAAVENKPFIEEGSGSGSIKLERNILMWFQRSHGLEVGGARSCDFPTDPANFQQRRLLVLKKLILFLNFI